MDIGLLSTISAAVIGAIITFWIGRKSSKQMNISFSDTSGLISKITGLFAVSQMVGIETAYENREIALLERDASGESAKSFLKHLKSEPKLIVVGSSLLGLRMYITKLAQYLSERNDHPDYETKFLLTHPCFTSLREDQEKRGSGQIQKEVQDTLRFLEKEGGLALQDSVRFYMGTPTCFMILTSNAMLLNPYPYQTEAYKAFCLEVRRLENEKTTLLTRKAKQVDILRAIDSDRFETEIKKAMENPNWTRYDYSGDIGSDIYGQFYWYHYFLPWFSKQAVTYDEYSTHCEKCDHLNKGFNTQCKIIEIRKQNNGIQHAV